MADITRILHPTDFSTSAETALAQAIRLARRYEAEVHVLHVLHIQHSFVEGPLPSAYAGSGSMPELFREAQQDAEQHLEEMVQAVDAPDVHLKPVLSPGAAAAPVILEYAEEEGMDLIVMGTHGRRAVERFLLGSVAEQVVHESRCDTLIVRAHEDDAEPRPIQRLLVPVDFSEAAGVALGRAKTWAAHHGAHVDVLHVIEPLPFTVSLASSVSVHDLDPDIIEHTTEELRDFVEETEGPEVPHALHVEEGEVAASIIRKADALSTDLIVMGSQGRSAFRRFVLGSVTERVLRTAKQPVLTARNAPQPQD